MNDRHDPSHLSAGQFQAFLERELPPRDLARAEEHLASCARCAGELAGWRVLFDDLGDLPSHRPHEGFADRVMAGVEFATPAALGERVRGRIRSLATVGSGHLSSAIMQDFFDGALAAREAQAVDRHLTSCGECASEADAWGAVLARLDGLESFAPDASFADRVMARVSVAAPVPIAARFRRRVAALRGAPAVAHIPEGLLQDYVDGALPKRAVGRIEGHLAACDGCTSETDAWRAVAARLRDLGHFAPSEPFADRVVAGVRIGSAVAKPPLAARLAAAAGRLVPHTRQAWAALSGVAVTPAVVTGLILYAVFSHPTLTLGSLFSFGWWQLTDLARTGLTLVSSAAVRSSEAFGLYSLFELLASAPVLVAGAVLAYTAVSALALRVLYKNLIASRPSDGRYTHVTAAS